MSESVSAASPREGSEIVERNWQLSGFGDEIHDDPHVQFAVLQALGASHVEVRSAWGTNVVDFTESQLDDFEAALTHHDMSVSAIASPIGKVSVDLPIEHELERLDAAIRAAQRFGASFIRIFSFYYAGDPASVRDAVIERMLALAERASSAGLTLLHENEKEIFGDIPDRVVDILQTVNSSALRAAWDAANFVQVGVRPFEDAFSRIRPYLAYVQVKDARFSDAAVTPAGLGDGDLARTIAVLRDDGFEGFFSLEPHLSTAFETGGFSGPRAFGVAARALASLVEQAGVRTP